MEESLPKKLLAVNVCIIYVYIPCKKVNKKVQKKPQAEAAANPRHQEEEKKWHRLTCT